MLKGYRITKRVFFGFLGLILFFFVQPIHAASISETSSEEKTAKGLGFGFQDVVAEFHGFLNMEYFDFGKDSGHPNSSFDSHNFYISTRAEIAPDVVLFGEVEHEHGATIKVDRAFIDWELLDQLTLRAGRFYVPFSYERINYWAPVRLMTSRPFLVDIPFHEWSDSGLEVFGRMGMFGYDLSLVNGPFALTENGIPITDVRDNNKNKTGVARLNFYPLSSFQAGIAYGEGVYDSAGQLGYKLYEVDARFRKGPLDVWFEYDKRTGDDEPCVAAPLSTCDPLFSGDVAGKDGFYVAVTYNVLENVKHAHYLKPIIRYDQIRTLNPDQGAKRETVGLNWSPKPHMVLKSEYQWTQEFGQADLEDNGFMLAIVLDF
jgi:hypothetical protein